MTRYPQCAAEVRVSIRRADYWLVEGVAVVYKSEATARFQSAGRIIGWLKAVIAVEHTAFDKFQSAGRIIGWLKVASTSTSGRRVAFQSAGRIIGWLKTGGRRQRARR